MSVFKLLIIIGVLKIESIEFVSKTRNEDIDFVLRVFSFSFLKFIVFLMKVNFHVQVDVSKQSFKLTFERTEFNVFVKIISN